MAKVTVMDLTMRAAAAADAASIYRLMTACEADRGGRAEASLDSIAADLARPALDRSRDTLVALDPAGQLVAWAWVHLGRRAQVDVHPSHQKRGLGARLLAWTEQRARELGSQRLGQNVSDDDGAAGELLPARGYERLATAWLLVVALTAEPLLPQPPDGITVRSFQSGDERAAYGLIEDAFSQWQQRRRTYAEWARLTVQRETFAPALSLYERVGMTVQQRSTHFSKPLTVA